MTRIVFDTNVMISALLFNDSLPARAFFRASHRGMILVSGALVGELSRVLRRDRFDRYVTREERDEFLESLIRESNLIEITEAIQACRLMKASLWLSISRRENTRLTKTNWLHPTGFLPAGAMRKCGQGVSAPGMPAACRADLADRVCQIHDRCCYLRAGEHDD